MTIDDDVLSAYVLGTLTEAEEAEVERYLADHPDAAQAVQHDLDALAAMVLSDTPVALPADAETLLLERIREEGQADAQPAGHEIPVSERANAVPTPPAARPTPSPRPLPDLAVPPAPGLPGDRRRPRNPNWWIGLAAAAIVAAVLWLGIPRYQDYLVARRLDALCATQGTACSAVENEQGARLGTVALLADGGVHLVLDAPPPSGRVYQGWDVIADKAVPLEISTGRVLEVKGPLAPQSTFAVTVEPPGGSAQPTTTPFLAVQL